MLKSRILGTVRSHGSPSGAIACAGLLLHEIVVVAVVLLQVRRHRSLIAVPLVAGGLVGERVANLRVDGRR